MHTIILKNIREALQKGDRKAVEKLTAQAYEQGVNIKEIINSARGP